MLKRVPGLGADNISFCRLQNLRRSVVWEQARIELAGVYVIVICLVTAKLCRMLSNPRPSETVFEICK